eukprot:scaffold4766_cov115-Isochrysis_galbana.AAC.10
MGMYVICDIADLTSADASGRAPTVTPRRLEFGKNSLGEWLFFGLRFQWCQGHLGFFRGSCAAGTESWSWRVTSNQGTLRRNRFTGSVAVWLKVGCLGWLRACFKAVFEAHLTVYGYGWFIGSLPGDSRSAAAPIAPERQISALTLNLLSVTSYGVTAKRPPHTYEAVELASPSPA